MLPLTVNACARPVLQLLQAFLSAESPKVQSRGLTNVRQQLRDGSEPESVKPRWVGCFPSKRTWYHPKTNMERAYHHFEKEKQLPNHHVVLCLVGELVSPQWKHDKYDNDNHMNKRQWKFSWTKRSLWFLDVPVCFPWWIAVVSYMFSVLETDSSKTCETQNCLIPSLENSAGDQNFLVCRFGVVP